MGSLRNQVQFAKRACTAVKYIGSATNLIIHLKCQHGVTVDVSASALASSASGLDSSSDTTPRVVSCYCGTMCKATVCVQY